MSARFALLLLAVSPHGALALHTGPSSRRVLLQRIAAASSAAVFAARPHQAQAARKGLMAPKREAEEPICFGPNYVKVPCGPAVEDMTPTATPLAKPNADTPDRIDVNNMVPVEFTLFPGLYPTISGKLLNAAPLDSKKDAYAALDSDFEREQLKVYDKYLVIQPRNTDLMQYKTAGTYFRGKGGDSKRSGVFRDEEIARLQNERKQ